ncbi:MAG: hypothetical protein WD066_13040 [Planctomycetaceae bacterium]
MAIEDRRLTVLTYQSLLGFGPLAEVLEPPELRRSIAESTKKILPHSPRRRTQGPHEKVRS